MTAPGARATGILVLVCLSLAACSVARAQPPAAPLPPTAPGDMPARPPANPPAAAVPAEPVVERQPPIFYLPDADGKLQPVLNFPLAEFQQLLTLRNALGGGPAQPQYSLTIEIQGRQTTDRAELTLKGKIKLARDGWARVPLRLAGAALRKSIAHEGDGETLLEFDADGDGYVIWLQGKAGDEHTIELSLLAPLSTVGDETRLKLSLPINEPARFEFTTSIPDAQATVTPPALVESRESTADATKLNVVGLTGEFEMAWRPKQVSRPDTPTVLQAGGTIQVSLDGRTVTSEATIVATSLGGGEFDAFDIRLPPAAELVTPPRQDYSLIESDDDSGDVVRIKLPNPTAEPVEVRLVTQRPYTPAAADSWLELAGFEIVGAARQTGFLSVQVVGDWQVIWGERRGVRQVETLPEALRRPEVLAGFEYLSERASLLARVVPRETRLGVEPEYLLLVDDDRVRLEARLRYTIRGAKAFALEVDMGDWQIDEVGPATLLDLNGLAPEQRSPLSLPLLQPTIGELQVAVRAHRMLPPDAHEIRVTLPRPRVNALGPAAVVVLPADNVTLVERHDAMQGLDRQALKLPADLPPRQQEPLVFRGDAGTLVFAADFRVEPGTVASSVEGTLELGDDEAKLAETLRFDIAHEPVESLLLLAPRAMLANPGLEFLVDDKTVKPVALGSDAQTPPGLERIRLGLTKSTIGPCTVKVVLTSTEEPLPTGTTVARSWPLVMPGEGTIRRCAFKVIARPGVEVHAPSSDWIAASSPQGAAGELLLTAEGARYDLPLAVAISDRAPFGGTFVERAWVQTWLAGGAPQQRVSMLLVTDEPSVDVQLPSDMGAGLPEVRVDGRRVAPTSLGSSRLKIAMPTTADDRHRLEFDYRLAPTTSHLAPKLQLPVVVPEVWVRRVYWELILPPGDHLWSPPRDLFGEYRWQWSGLGWSRQPTLQTGELENWIGVAHRNPPPPGAARFLMSGSGISTAGVATSVARRTVVLVAAGCALAMGLLLVYVPATRHPAVLLVGGVVLATLAVSYPEPTMLVAQAAVWGVALALVALVLRSWTLRRHQPRFVPRPRGSSIIDLGSTARQRAGSGKVPSTSEPAPLPMAISAGEPQ